MTDSVTEPTEGYEDELMDEALDRVEVARACSFPMSRMGESISDSRRSEGVGDERPHR